MVQITLQPRRIATILVTAAAVLVALYVVTQYYRIRIAPQALREAMQRPDWPADAALAQVQTEKILDPRRVVTFCDLDAEANLPSTWSVLQLLLAAALLALVAKHRRAVGDHWWVLWTALSIGFVILSIDEGGSLHGSMYLAASSEEARKARGVFYFSWIIPAMMIAAIVGLAYLRFLFTLPPPTRWLILLAGAWYVGSAVGGEMAQGWWQAHSMGKQRFGWVAITILEEAGEMLSIALFIHALLCHMRDQQIAAKLRVAEPDALQPAPLGALATPTILPGGELDERAAASAR